MSDPEARPGPPIVSLRNVGVSYWMRRGILSRRRHWALHNVSFDLHRGESLGVVGRNGVGKSTLLRLLAGVMLPDKGTLVRSVERVTLLTLRLGFLEYLSGRENIALGGLFLGLSRREIEARADAIIAFSELGEAIDAPVVTYSSGMKARLGLALALEVEPDVLLVDEVTGVGDQAFRKKSFAAMQERIRSRSSTVVFVSHNANHVRRLCNRAVWIEDGVTRMEGPTPAVLDAYESWMEARPAPRPADRDVRAA
jgi:lipopolysaccharide transport system ATP-binding protein